MPQLRPKPDAIAPEIRRHCVGIQPQLREKLWDVVHALQNGLKERGFNLGKTTTMVTPVILQGNTYDAANLVIDFRENYGIFCSMVIYPVVPKGIIMLRIIPTAAHTLEDVNETITAFEAISEKLKKGLYSAEIASAV